MGKLYYWYKGQGICPRCGSENASKGHTLCLNCRDKQTVATGLYRAKMSEKRKAEESEKNKVYCRMRYEQYKASGICVRCHKNEARKGAVICQNCFNKIRTYQKVYQQERRDENVRKMQEVSEEV